VLFFFIEPVTLDKVTFQNPHVVIHGRKKLLRFMRVRVSFMPEFVGELTLSYNYIKLIANRLNCLGHNSLKLNSVTIIHYNQSCSINE